MEIERETIVELVVSAVGVGLFISALVVIGISFNQNGLSGQGALALIVSIVLFIVLMTAVGYWLSSREGAPEQE